MGFVSKQRRRRETRRQRGLWEGTVRKHVLRHLTETIDQNRLINVCVLHIFISVSNINGRKRICFSNEREAIKYFRHTSLKTQSRERTCIFKAPQFTMDSPGVVQPRSALWKELSAARDQGLLDDEAEPLGLHLRCYLKQI